MSFCHLYSVRKVEQPCIPCENNCINLIAYSKEWILVVNTVCLLLTTSDRVFIGEYL